ncbi:MAG: hypothetical protein WAX69_06820 [Victivallales bacterium]
MLDIGVCVEIPIRLNAETDMINAETGMAYYRIFGYTMPSERRWGLEKIKERCNYAREKIHID